MYKTIFPLHPAQRDIYMGQEINFESPHNNIGFYVKLKGALNKEKLREAVNSSPKIFDAFRLRFDLQDVNLICYFDENYNRLELAEMDFSGRKNPEHEAKSWMQNGFNVPFIIRKENLLFEPVLIKIASDEYWLFFKFHQIIIDSYGLAMWLNYVSKKYTSLLIADDLKFHYGSYVDEAIKASEFLNSPDYELDGKYWKKKINEQPEALLRKNNRFITKPTTKSGNYYLKISPEQRKIIDKVINVTQSNLDQLTIAALLIYFGKTSGQSNIVFGINVPKRSSVELQNIVGKLSGVLPFKGVFEEDIKLADLLKDIAISRKEDCAHQNYLVSDLIEFLKIDTSKSSLYDVTVDNVLFNFQIDFGTEIQSTIFWLQSEYEKVPLQICWRDYGNQQPLELGLHYNYEYFISEEIDLFAKRIIFILEQFPFALNTNIGNINILPSQEQQLLGRFNGATEAYPIDKNIVDLFEQQVELTPDNIALVLEDQHLTYSELNERSNQLGHYLRSKGVKEDTLVPVCIERSVEMIVAMLGILKAGGAYVPIDPEYPEDRISYMLQDIAASVVVSSKKSRLKLPLAEDSKVVEVDADRGNISLSSKDKVPTSLRSHHLAYVIYTSGSTGRPKGIMVEHRSLVASTLSRKRYYKTFGSVFLIPSFSFDSSVAVIFGTLLTGGRLVLCEDQLIKDINFVRGLLRNVETILCVPSYYKLLLEEGVVENSSLSKVIVAGEDLNRQIVSLHFDKTNNVSLFNEYGPTEYTIWATVAKIEAVTGKVTIGAPIDNTSIYIVGKGLCLTPIGVAGEICIAGEGLARGYLNNEELSRQKFVPNPFVKEAGVLMYKTGDMGKWLGDGSIQFLGRKDEQVKIRGYRIELGELESVLQQYDQVRQGVVLAREDKEGRKRLVGYVVPKKGSLDREVLMRYLSSKLPQYMIPGLWVEIKKLPLTPNGKIDRKALPDVDASEEALSQQYQGPRNVVEAKLCVIWQDLLEVERVGIHDNFFELGGDSLLAMRLISYIGKELEVEVIVKDLFVHCTIAALSAHIERQNKQLLLPVIERRAREERIPLSFSQERLWFIDRLEGSVQYHIPQVLRVKGKLNADALEASFKGVMHRHEVLRTVIKEDEGRGWQYIKEEDGWRLEIVYGSLYNEDTDALQSYIQQLIVQPFNLAEDYMLRAQLIKLEEEDQVLVITIHHIVTDGWSTPLFVKELTELYAAYEQGRPPNLPSLPIQYADYAIWQRQYLHGAVLEAKLSYWKEKLQEVQVLQLPTDFVRPAVQSTKGAVEGFLIDKQLGEQLKTLSKQQGTTLFMTLLAAFKVLLFRYSGQEDICVGSPTASRQQQEVEGLIGFFANTLALRDKVKGDASFVELLQTVKATTLDAYQHQEVPFEKVVDEVTRERDVSRNPLFQVMFASQNTRDVPELHLGNTEISTEVFADMTAKFDLTLFVEETRRGLQSGFEYCTELFEARTIGRMADHFQSLLQSIVTAPHQKIAALPMLTEAERQQLLEEFNPRPVAYPLDRTIVDLFKQQVESTPDNVAVIFQEQRLSYRELNERSNQLAHYLRSKGVKEECLVPICIERSHEMLVGLLGILKSGAAYVPIDPEYPQERITFMLEDIKANIVVAGKAGKLKLKITDELDIIDLFKDWPIIEKMPRTNLQTNFNNNNLAYVVYTSGSTGQPKGVMIEHGSLLNYVLVFKDYFSITQNDFVIQQYSISFDTSMEEIYPALISGGCVCIIKDGRDVEKIKQYIEDGLATVLSAAPMTIEWLNNNLSGTGQLRYVINGGDVLYPSSIDHLFKKVNIVNGYGPSETTIGVTYNKVKSISEASLIGKPIANVRIYILGHQNQLQAIGIPGEIHIGGLQVSRGYLNRPELTHKKFVQDPFNPLSGCRMYKTGDMGKWLGDGSIQFLGRKDEQVKIRGYRIELGELESVLQQYDQVRQGVVLAREDKEGRKRLVGYIVPTKGSLDREALILYLSSKLPQYMVPGLWVEIEKLPLTPNGKIDRKALPDVDASEEALSKQYQGPRNEVEAKLCVIWQDLLEVERVGIHDNFFELGGDSIITIQISSRAKRAGYEIRPRDIFLYQDISRLSAAIINNSTASAFQAEQGELLGECSLLPIQQWYLEKENDNPLISYYNQSMLVGIHKAVTLVELTEALRIVIIKHDVLRFVYKHSVSGWTQIYGSSHLTVTECDFRSEPIASLSSTISNKASDYQAGLDIEKGDLLRVVLFQTPNEQPDNRLLLVIHHLAVDGVSWRVLLEDLEVSINSIRNSESLNLGRKSSSYRDWYNALKEYSNHPRLLSQQSRWQTVVENAKPLPTDLISDQEVKFRDWDVVTVKLNVVQTQLLLQQVPLTYHTEINDVLLAALSKVLVTWTGNNKILIGLEGHGREEYIGEGIDLSRTVGWFTTIYPLLLESVSEESEGSLLKATKEQLRQIPDKGLGYGVLKYFNKLKELNIEAGKDPWDIVFNYLGQFDNVISQSNLFTRCEESPGKEISDSHRISEKIAVNSLISGGELKLDWGYSRKHYRKETIEQLGQSYIIQLEELIRHCLKQGEEGSAYTPSDYGLEKEVSYKELDSFLEGKRTSIESLYRLSGLQEGMLFHSLYNEGANAYVLQFVCELPGVRTDIFLKSWDSLIRRHSILRSAFYYEVFAIPIQCVYRQATLPVEELDYRHMESVAQQEALQVYEEADRNKGFDFTQPPLMRLALIRIEEERYHMVWTSHHILSDGWSLPLIIEELQSTYASLLAGIELHTQEEDSYQDYIRYIESRDKHKEEEYWRTYMSGIERPVLLPFIHSALDRTKGIGHYEEESLHIDKDFTARINEYVQRRQLTLNTLIQMVWSYLLYRYTGESHVTFGVTVSGRPEELANIERRVGMYSNTLPFHTKFKEDRVVDQFLHDLQLDQVYSRQYQYSRLNDIQQWVHVHGDLFDNIIVFENYPISKVVFSNDQDLQIKELRMNEQSNYPLCITIVAAEDILIGFNYNTRLLEEYYVKQMTCHFRHVLTQIIEGAPNQRIGEFELLSRQEQQQLLEEFNGSTKAYSMDKSIVDLFELQVALTPDNIALVFEGQHLTYRELNERANQMGHYLRSKGVKEETLVPICIERSFEMIVGILGILKAGGAYVPLDPQYPQERINYMLHDTSASLVVSSKESRSRLPMATRREVVEVDADWANISYYSKEKVPASLDPHDLASVIYTSGSTGSPKGVMIEHKSVISLVKGISYVSLTNKDVLLSTGSFSFDATTFEYWGMLLNGGQLVLCTENRLLDSELLKEEIITRKVNKMWFTSSWFNQLVDLDISVFSRLETLIVGGEKLSEHHVEKIRRSYPHIAIINGYGPTENTTFSLTYKITETEINKPISIGRPLSNRSVYILDKEDRLNPIGVVGEIYIAGDGLARGYLNNEVLTRQKFVSNPFSKETGARMYKTGDLGRWLPDGNIEFVGRVDDQVKIRGYRIELGEIESVLQQCEQVKEAVVQAREDKEGTKRLVGYVVPQEGGLNRQELTQYLSSKLPQYMIPVQWVELKQFPLTANGKIDYKALPGVDAADALVNQYAPPHNDVEAKLCVIYQKVLKVEKVGIYDNFFELGGDSIKTIQVVGQVKGLGYTLQAKDLFHFQTIEKLSKAIITQSAAGVIKDPELEHYFQKQEKEVSFSNNYANSLIPARIEGSKTPLYMVCGGAGTVFKFKPLIDMLDSDQPVYVLQQPTDTKDLETFPVDIKGIAAWYINAILVQNPYGPYALSGHCLGGIVAFEMAKQLEAMGKKVALLAMFDTIIEESEKREPATFRNFFYGPDLIKDFLLKVHSKVHFETFLFTKHTKYAIQYKINSIKNLITKIFGYKTNKKENSEFEIFARLEDMFESAYLNYEMTAYNGEVVIFYAKDHYYFIDSDNNINYKKLDLSDSIKSGWKRYATSPIFHEIAGEHSTIFEPDIGGKELAQKLQEVLNRCTK
ncbi:non-ribosomal peptide synthetase [Segetibacter koreensis]|uniref:non-ribosomal peptide synthetase n=1 Tax=Segetibacter koreensis TaxID=398037 RepID=UPI000378470A|nr:non-ribosomal peptide synthetase [Segetibacter koreensis]